MNNRNALYSREHKVTNEYEQAKEQSASYRREMKRLTTEIENLQDNLTNSMTKGILADGSIKAIDEQIQSRLARLEELADLEKKPIGTAIGRARKAYSEQEDTLIKRFYKDEISQDEIIEMTSRKLGNIRARARKLGLKYYPPKATWEWLNGERRAESESPSRRKYRPR